MTYLLARLHADEGGFVVSAELVIIATLVVIGLIVGLAEVANGVNEELEDVGSAIGALNQTYVVQGTVGHKARLRGSKFFDKSDFCDAEDDISCDSPAVREFGHF
jgi:Flp pilus assembly pilin Flp